ncbi:hypothetical protein GR212_35785 [Rhizobium lusitanum]|uniref:Uncharacterized protein n=1 Tax=Rhizobium lusitanum TaxID=293958 RepID=A0A6L9ULB2_9HYPH|nr:hypothetical protein [Rhizobium lusitanum]
MRRPVESAQYVSIKHSERLVEAGIGSSVGSVGDPATMVFWQKHPEHGRSNRKSSTARPCHRSFHPLD